MIPKIAHRYVIEMLQGRSGAGVPAQPAEWYSYRMAAVRRHARRNPTAAGRTGTDIRESVNPIIWRWRHRRQPHSGMLDVPNPAWNVNAYLCSLQLISSLLPAVLFFSIVGGAVWAWRHVDSLPEIAGKVSPSMVAAIAQPADHSLRKQLAYHVDVWRAFLSRVQPCDCAASAVPSREPWDPDEVPDSAGSLATRTPRCWRCCT